MKKIPITMMLLFTLFFIATSAMAQKVLLDENFNTNSNNWLSDTAGTNISYLVYNGKYVISVNDSLTYNVNMPVTLNDAGNFTVTLTTTHIDGSVNYGYGLFFGSSDLSNYYAFYIASSGYYELAKVSSSKTTDLIKWTASPAIRKGNYVDNILQLSKQGTNWNIAVDGQTLGTVPAMPFMGNKLGFSQSTHQQVMYDDVKVVQN